MSTIRVTVLGCGSSGGVPRADGDWGICDPTEPKNRRTRCSLLLQRWEGEAGDVRDSTTVLIDTAPELREQLAGRVSHIDAILYSHDHADQTHGIDDVRAIVLRMRRRIPVWMDEPTRTTMLRRFGYIFQGEGAYPAILDDAGSLLHGQDLVVQGPGGGFPITPLDQDHGNGVVSLGFRFGPAAYSNDVVQIPAKSLERLHGLDLWIVDALRRRPHPTHAHMDQALAWVEMLKPARSVLTDMHLDMDYRTLVDELPHGVEPAYDGWSVDLTV